MFDLYGIPNCDTIKKARRWLDEHGVDYTFHNYKQAPPTPELLTAWTDRVDWQLLLNRRGLTWRKLSDEQKHAIDKERAIRLMCEYPSMIKRPVLIGENRMMVGFSEDQYHELLG